ncbi:metal-sulfur cluster assembly factor [Thermaerobacter litoralis]
MAKVTEEQVREALTDVIDPEIGLNVVDLGLVYRCEVDDEGVVEVDMTLTAIGCPLGDQIVSQAKQAIERLEGVKEARVRLVWSPPWRPEMMSERARMLLGF